MKIRTGLLLIIASLLMLTAAVSAEISASSDEDNNITVSGSIDEKDGTIVSIKVIRTDNYDEWCDAETEEQIKTIIHLEQVKAADAGYSCTFKMLGDEGAYTAVAGSKKTAEQHKNFMFIDYLKKGKVLEALNAAKTSADSTVSDANITALKTVLQNSGNYLDIANSQYDAISDDGKTAVLCALSKNAPYEDIEEAADVVRVSSLLQKFYETSTGQKIAFLTDNAAAMKISESYFYGWLEGKDETLLEQYAENLAIDRPEAVHGMTEALDEYTVLFEIYKSDHSAKTKELLLKNQGRLKADISDYLALASTAAIDEKITGVLFADSASLKMRIDGLIAETPKKPSQPKTDGGGGGGGGGLKPTYIKTDLGLDENNATAETAVLPFADVDKSHWAYEGVLRLYQTGAVSGNGDNQFLPENFITREEFLKIILAATELTDDDAQCSFDDVAFDVWYYKYVSTAYEYGFINGIGSNKFGVGSYITRQDAVKICNSVCEFKGIALKEVSTAEFADSGDIAGYALPAVKAFANAGIISGDENQRFLPESYITRAEAAKIIFNILIKG